MSTKAQAMLEEIKALPPLELLELSQHVYRLAAEAEAKFSPVTEVSDQQFQASLDEVTGCTAGSHALHTLLAERRRDREREEARLETRKKGPACG